MYDTNLKNVRVKMVSTSPIMESTQPIMEMTLLAASAISFIEGALTFCQEKKKTNSEVQRTSF